jgi:hypothetical protein
MHILIIPEKDGGSGRFHGEDNSLIEGEVLEERLSNDGVLCLVTADPRLELDA